ncbi:MAG: nuclear transport factor 2 family protein [Candidatus Phaeomarinobacter sp.]
MIEKCIADWHDYIINKQPGGLEDLIADDCVFLSPVVFTPQHGKDLTLAYLRAAGGTLGGQAKTDDGKPADNAGKFKYTKEVLAGNQAVLEFETEMNGKYVNGVDIITCNDEGKITEFRVMIRPLQAVQAVHAAMGAMLQKMKEAS